MSLKNDLLIAVIIAIIVHLGMAFADISVKYPAVSVRKENAHYLKITFVAPTKDSEKKVQEKLIPPKHTPTPVSRKKDVPRKTQAVRRTIDQPRQVRQIETEQVVAGKVETAEIKEITTVNPIRSDAESPCATAAKAEPPSPATVISPAVPRYKENTPPVYPRQARRRGYEGIVLLSVMVLDNGTVGEVRIKESSGHSCLDTAALKTVKQWKFEPATRLGTVIPMWVDVPVRFTLKGHMHS